MGLDMYLTKEIYIGARFKHRSVNGKIEITAENKPVPIELNKVKSIIEDVGYWRKANAIHKWFVDKIQNGKDNCQESYVPYEKLIELRDLCEKVLKTKDASLLPPESGFFFGSTEIDEDYFSDLKDTIKIINSLDKNGDYYYQASW